MNDLNAIVTTAALLVVFGTGLLAVAYHLGHPKVQTVPVCPNCKRVYPCICR